MMEKESFKKGELAYYNDMFIIIIDNETIIENKVTKEIVLDNVFKCLLPNKTFEPVGEYEMSKVPWVQ